MKTNKKGQFIKQSKVNEFYDGFGIWYDKKGYPTIWIDGKSIKVHVYVWERRYGAKPKGTQLHHVDNNKGNYALDNLQLVTQSEHFKIHAGWKKLDGEWYSKSCKECKGLLKLDRFYERRTVNTPSNVCIECSKIVFKKRNTAEYRAKRKIYMKEYYKKNREVILKQQKIKYKEVARV